MEKTAFHDGKDCKFIRSLLACLLALLALIFVAIKNTLRTFIYSYNANETCTSCGLRSSAFGQLPLIPRIIQKSPRNVDIDDDDIDGVHQFCSGFMGAFII